MIDLPAASRRWEKFPTLKNYLFARRVIRLVHVSPSVKAVQDFVMPGIESKIADTDMEYVHVVLDPGGVTAI